MMEERSDAFKYCHVNKRPFPTVSSGIGPWLTAFEILGFVSVATNFALIALHPDAREYFKDLSDVQYIIMFVVGEVRLYFKKGLNYKMKLLFCCCSIF